MGWVSAFATGYFLVSLEGMAGANLLAYDSSLKKHAGFFFFLTLLEAAVLFLKYIYYVAFRQSEPDYCAHCKTNCCHVAGIVPWVMCALRDVVGLHEKLPP